MKLEFGFANESELPEIADLVNSAYRGESSRQGWTTEADFLTGIRTNVEMLTQIQKHSNEKIVTVKSEGKIIVCVHLEITKDKSCYLGMFTVKPNLQARGLGKILLTHAESLAKYWGCPRMILGVINIRSELISWYERRGYKRYGREELPENDPALQLTTSEKLHFVMFEKPLL